MGAAVSVEDDIAPDISASLKFSNLNSVIKTAG
jgi:hypothetical protein